jgi:hypothetical protein
VARYDEAEEARENLLAGMDELRRRADNFLAVAASTAALFAVLARSTPTNRRHAGGAPAPDSRGPSRGRASALSGPGTARALGDAHLALAPYPDAGVGGVIRPRNTGGTVRLVTRDVPRAIVSPNSAAAIAGRRFSFTVTTIGTPLPSLTEKGDLPEHVAFSDNGNGTATLSGTPTTAGVSHLVLRAKYGGGTARYAVTQAFVLTVAAHD